jgi:hypothetical protein
MTNRRMVAAVVTGAVLGAASVCGTAGAQMAPSAGGQSTAAVSAQERAITDRYLTTVHTELVSKVDTAKAKPGQEVAVRVLDDAELADGTKLSKGSKLLGRVLQVQARNDSAGGAAAVVLLFDRAEVKGGQTVAVRTVIEMVAPVGGVGKADPVAMRGEGRGMATDPTIGIADSSRAGIGSNGGVLGNVGRGIGGTGRGVQPPLGGAGGIDGAGVGAAGPMGGQVGANGTGQIGTGQIGGMGTGQVGIDGSGSIDAAGPIGSRPIDNVGSIAGGAGPIRDIGVRPVVSAGENVSGGARPTALPGVVLSQASSTGGSGMLVSMSRNITLDSGTRITMGVIRH